MTAPIPLKDAADAAYAGLARHVDIQSSFPSFEKPQPPAWLEALGRFLLAHGTLLSWIFWILVGGVVLAGVFVLIREYWPLLSRWGSAARPVRAEQKFVWQPTAAQARQLLRESDALAAEGHYAEAIHLILLRSIEDIEERRPRLVRPTLTSREIGLLHGLPDAARTAFARIARTVEHALFAGHQVGADEFQLCRREYEEFALEPVWRPTR